MERYTPLVSFCIWMTFLGTNTLHTSPQVQHTVKIMFILNSINQSVKKLLTDTYQGYLV